MLRVPFRACPAFELTSDKVTIMTQLNGGIARHKAGFDAPESEVIRVMAKDGICIVENALTKDETAALKDELLCAGRQASCVAQESSLGRRIYAQHVAAGGGQA